MEPRSLQFIAQACAGELWAASPEQPVQPCRVRSIEPAGAQLLHSVVPTARPYGDPSHPQVVARLTRRGVLLVETEPDIGGLVEREEDGSGSITFRCPSSELAYFARYFAGLGDEVEVIAPEELREAILHSAEKLTEKYRKR